MKPASVLLLFLVTAVAPAAERVIAPVERCISCHDADGRGLHPLWPDLAGQKRGYLVKQLRAFRDGSRSEPMMLPVVLELTDAEIDALADHYSRLPRSQP